MLLIVLGTLGACQPRTPFDFDIDDPGPHQITAPPANGVPAQGNEEDEPDPARRPARPRPDEPLSLTVEEAVFMAMENNRALRVQQYAPLIAGTFEDLERAVYDPSIGAIISASRVRGEQLSPATQETFLTRSETQAGEVDIGQFLPTGTDWGLDLSVTRSTSDRVPDQYETRVGLSLTQALLRGASYAANLVGIQQARLDTLASQYELRGFAENLVADVETTYWNLALAQREIEIFENSLELAEQQLHETQQRVEVGVVAETELAAARAEVAQRREDLINARANLETIRLRLLRLISPSRPQRWDRPVDAAVEVTPPNVALDDVEDHVQVARRYRPEVNEARLRLQQGRLEMVRTRNGLLPRLDLFANLGKSGFADSFGDSVRDIDGRSYDLTGGVVFEYVLGNRAARADHQRARFTRNQAAESVHNLTELVELDVYTAYIEAERAREQVAATIATRELREQTLRAESEKFRVGVSTAFLVAQAQRDYLASQIAEAQAQINHRLALIEFYRLEGSLLLRRGIEAPGDEPVTQ